MKDISTRVGFGIVVLLCVAVAGAMVWPFIPAILWAATFSILLYPLFTKLVEKRKWPRSLAALAVTMIPTLVLIIPAVIFGTIAGVQVYGFGTELINSAKNGGSDTVWKDVGHQINLVVEPILSQFNVSVNVEQMIQDNKDSIAKTLSGPLASGLRSFVVTIVTLVVSLLTTYFMIKDSHHVKEPVLDLVPLPREETEGILKRMAVTVRSVFYAVVVVALIQGAVAGLTFLIAGVEAWLVLTLITTVLCMIPLLGSPLVTLPVGVSLLAQGKIWQGVMVLAVGFGVVTQIDNFLRPVFISGETKIHPMAIFFALLGGVLVMGPVGLMAGPLILTLILALVDVARVKQKLEKESELSPESS